ncbi:hypothetical protein HYALB_00012871 [Hymenoscyphus albidus]|uniref:Uncharacterized protein n=1 Tax=Hymenoscyphus albidus TaxID=595503 RepID=A0A9N9LYA3_9HELO|nr:hypothetical protein HYALB_00012871 [Hymenoscyphus albidus]
MTFGESEDYTLLPPLYNPTSLPDNLQAQRELTALKGKYQLIDGRKWSETTFERILEHLSPFKDSVYALDQALPARNDVNITAKVFGSKRIRESLLQAARDDKLGVFAGIVDEDDNDLFGNSVSN